MKGNEKDFSALKENHAHNEVGNFLKYHLEYLIFFFLPELQQRKGIICFSYLMTRQSLVALRAASSATYQATRVGKHSLATEVAP